MHPPNILLITVDTLRFDRVGCFGGGVLTPFLDSLASRGVVFRQAVTCGSWTQAAFPPIMSSTSASGYGGCTGQISPHRPCPVQTLTDAGYSTAGFTANPLVGRAFGYDRGFTHFEDVEPEGSSSNSSEGSIVRTRTGEHTLQQDDPFLRGVKGGQFLLRRPLTHRIGSFLGINLRPAAVYAPAPEMVARVARWLEYAQEPFFVWVHFMDVHWPYHLYVEGDGHQEAAREWRDLAAFHRAGTGEGQIEALHGLRLKKLYDRAVAYLDGYLAEVVGCVTKRGHRLGTVTIVLSDHGEEFNEHGNWGHLEPNIYDEILRVPLIIAPCKIREACVLDDPVSSIDLMPTILDLCACSFPEGLEGKSLVPFWASEASPVGRRATISEMWRESWHRVAVRTPEYKLIWEDTKPNHFELFDLKHDPVESTNVADLRPEMVRKLRVDLARHLVRMAETNALGGEDAPVPNRRLSERLKALGYLNS